MLVVIISCIKACYAVTVTQLQCINLLSRPHINIDDVPVFTLLPTLYDRRPADGYNERFYYSDSITSNEHSHMHINVFENTSDSNKNNGRTFPNRHAHTLTELNHERKPMHIWSLNLDLIDYLECVDNCEMHSPFSKVPSNCKQSTYRTILECELSVVLPRMLI